MKLFFQRALQLFLSKIYTIFYARAWFKRTRTFRPIRRGAAHAFFRVKSRRCIIKVASGLGTPRSMLSVPRAVHDLLARRLVRLSVCLSVQEIGFGDFVQIAVHVLSLAWGNTSVNYDTQVQKQTRAFFCFYPPTACRHSGPAFLPDILVASCHVSPPRNSFAKRPERYWSSDRK